MLFLFWCLSMCDSLGAIVFPHFEGVSPFFTVLSRCCLMRTPQSLSFFFSDRLVVSAFGVSFPSILFFFFFCSSGLSYENLSAALCMVSFNTKMD